MSTMTTDRLLTDQVTFGVHSADAATRAEALERIDMEIAHLLELKRLAAGENPRVRLLAVPERSHWFAMTVTILVLLIVLVLLVGTRTAVAPAGNPSGRQATASALTGAPVRPVPASVGAR